jgi:hypothetical protein
MTQDNWINLTYAAREANVRDTLTLECKAKMSPVCRFHKLHQSARGGTKQPS